MGDLGVGVGGEVGRVCQGLDDQVKDEQQLEEDEINYENEEGDGVDGEDRGVEGIDKSGVSLPISQQKTQSAKDRMM